MTNKAGKVLRFFREDVDEASSFAARADKERWLFKRMYDIMI